MKNNKFIYKKIGNFEQLKNFIIENNINIDVYYKDLVLHIYYGNIVEGYLEYGKQKIFNKKQEFKEKNEEFLLWITLGGIGIYKNEKWIMSDLGYDFIINFIKKEFMNFIDFKGNEKEEIKHKEKCSKCGGDMTLISISVDDDGKEYIVYKCVECGNEILEK